VVRMRLGLAQWGQPRGEPSMGMESVDVGWTHMNNAKRVMLHDGNEFLLIRRSRRLPKTVPCLSG